MRELVKSIRESENDGDEKLKISDSEFLNLLPTRGHLQLKIYP